MYPFQSSLVLVTNSPTLISTLTFYPQNPLNLSSYIIAFSFHTNCRVILPLNTLHDPY